MSVHLYRHERFVGPECSPQPLLRREVRCAIPLLLEKICYLAVIMGETGDSGHSPGLEGMVFC